MYIALTKAYASETIKVYSERQPFLIEPLINQYEEQNGNKIEWIFSKKGLVQKTGYLFQAEYWIDRLLEI